MIKKMCSNKKKPMWISGVESVKAICHDFLTIVTVWLLSPCHWSLMSATDSEDQW